MPDTLLLVDHDQSARDVVGAHFEPLGYHVLHEVSGAAAIATFRRAHPDVVLLDLYLPDASGLSVLERLRQEGAAVILLARPGDIESAVSAMKLGAENVLAKPVDIAQLAAVIARVREKARLSRQNAGLLARVREMRNVLERSMTLARGPAAIGVEHVANDLRPRTPSDRRYHAHTLSEIERQHIERTLRHHGGNRTRAALELGISRATLINKIKAYSLNI